MTMVRAAVTVGAFTGLSRVAGLARDVIVAGALGAGSAADAFFVAFKLANFLRRLVAEGAAAAAFVPLYTTVRLEDGEDAAQSFLSQALAMVALLAVAIVVAAELAMPQLVRVLAPGFAPDGERYAMAVELGRITFPYLALIAVVALLSGALNAHGRFAVVAATPVLMNLVLIAAGLAALKAGLAPATTLAWGLLVAGLAQLAWTVAAASRAGITPRPARPSLSPRLRRLGRLFLPGLAGTGLGQINLLVNSWFASSLATGAVAHLFYADRLVQLPLGLVGVALGTALLPALAMAMRLGEPARAREALARGVELGVLLSLPAAVGLVMLAEPIVRELFERGAFDAGATGVTAAAMAAMALGLPAHVLAKVLAPAFFAREDTATPVRVALLCMAVNIGVILVLVGPMAEVGIALAGTVSAWLNTVLLVLLLRRQGGLALGRKLRRRLAGSVAGAALMAVFLIAMSTPRTLSDLMALIIAAAGLFLVAALLAGGWRWRDLRRIWGEPGA